MNSVSKRTPGRTRIAAARSRRFGFVLARNLEILEFLNRPGPYVEFPPGAATLNTRSVISLRIRREILNAIGKIDDKQTSIRSEGLKVLRGTEPRTVNLVVSKVGAKSKVPGACWKVLIEELPADPAPAKPTIARRAHLRLPEAEPFASLGEDLKNVRAQYESLLCRKEEEYTEALQELGASREVLETSAATLTAANRELQDLNLEWEVTSRELEQARREALESEATIRAMLNSAAQAVVAVHEDGQIALVNDMTERMFGYEREELVGMPLDMLVPPGLRSLHSRMHEGYFAQPRIRPMGAGPHIEGLRKDGTQFPIEVGLSYITAEGQPLAIAFISDVTERRRLEKAVETDRQEIRALASRLLTAQDEERRRISRELHDDLCQQLSALAFDAGGLAADLQLREPTRVSLQDLESRLAKLTGEVRKLSYQLHPSILEDLGLAEALETLSKEFSRREQMDVKFHSKNVPGTLPMLVMSSLYRIAQEALRNAVKHSQARRVQVRLRGKPGLLELRIRDDGVGFDPRLVKGNGGLGLVGIGERSRLVNGKLTIASRPNRGTVISVAVDLQ
jgi:PAS domain S-box-containing protein